MPSDDTTTSFDVGLLSPLTVGRDELVSDGAVLDALVTVEVALHLAVAEVAPTHDANAVERAGVLGWSGPGELCRGHGADAATIARAAPADGNPVIPLVAWLRGPGGLPGAHVGATSQDALDSALMLTAARVRAELRATLERIDGELEAFALAHRDQVTAARTLTQHAVPTTVGLRAAGWLRGVRRAALRLDSLTLPGQLGGAAGTLASFVALVGEGAATRLPAAFAAKLALDTPDAPWHVSRWPVTELGDALVQVIDSLGKIATDVATLSRTEIGELSEGSTGGSSTMPQKKNPVASVLIRSAALRAPQLAATLHLASGSAGDERPDGAWHAEWPTLRELMRLALGATAEAEALLRGLVVDDDAVARNLALTGDTIASERRALQRWGATGDGPYLGLAAGLVDGIRQQHEGGDG